MNTPDEHPIEPLSSAAWARIEARLFDAAQPSAAPTGSSPRTWRTLWPVAAAAVLLIGLGGALLWRAGAVPQQQRYVSGDQPRLVTLPGATVRLEPGSVLQVDADAAAVRCRIEAGAGLFQVASRPHDQPFAVLAGDVRVEVVGTVFRVARAAEQVSVETFEGVVRVSAAGLNTLVARGERWPSALAPPPAVSEQQPPPKAAGAQADFDEAVGCENSDPAHALRLYADLSAGSGPWATNALFALGRLQLERGARTEARRTLQLYLQRYPDGANAVDARALLQGLTRERPRTRR
jgi:hypothetical protein